MLRKKQEVFSQPRDNLGQAPTLPHFWVVARSNCLLVKSTDSKAGDKTINFLFSKLCQILKSEKQ